ncbi:ComEA family DNA-binding protein [Bacillus sp. FSL K6-6540]|uniref:ComEA family DNA-binding protein n=1 Tax=Bacillus sp. FSL K6-6540 TaxID=2921512 RepID=UPI0030F7C5B2
MKRISLGWSLAATLAGCGLILFAGGTEQGIEGWQPLNEQLEQVMTMEESAGAKALASDSRDKDAGGAAAPADAAKTAQGGQGEPATNAKEPVPSLDPAAAAGNGQGAETSPSSASDQAAVSPASSPTEAVGQSVSANEPPALPPSIPDPSGLINVNTADAATLMELPGIGEAKAKAIIDYRNQFGPFRSQADLMNVKGIGPKMLEKMKPYVGL